MTLGYLECYCKNKKTTTEIKNKFFIICKCLDIVDKRWEIGFPCWPVGYICKKNSGNILFIIQQTQNLLTVKY